jgi:uncharacterized protein
LIDASVQMRPAELGNHLMAIAPIILRYKTKSGNSYAYDIGTNEIVRTGIVVDKILDDYRVLDADEMVEKYRALGQANVREALAKLDGFQSRGIFCDHNPELTIMAKWVSYRGQNEPIEDFMRSHTRLLTLEITQQCNLRCEYCCYGEHYPSLRNHAEMTMTLETAKCAVKTYIDKRPQRCSIGFYGGEPLLEFELLKQIVSFAEDYAAQTGQKTEFNMTTNGTLMTDDKIHFLVKHNFSVLISIDGPKELQDKYRVFRNQNLSKNKTGTYDVVMKNMRRFVELYPDYLGRGTIITITATTDMDKINEFINGLKKSYPVIIQNFVRNVLNDSQQRTDTSIRFGCWGSAPCAGNWCGKVQRSPCNEAEINAASADLDANGGTATVASEEIPEFSDWNDVSISRFNSSKQHFIEEVCRANDSESIHNQFSASSNMFSRNIQGIHARKVTKFALKGTSAVRCYPGSTRTFYSSQGVAFPCERTQTTELFQIGNTEKGIQVEKGIHLAEAVRMLSDCGNCVCKQICSLCPAVIQIRQNTDGPDGMAFQKDCLGRIIDLHEQLQDYTTVMEKNQEVVEKLLHSEQPADDWINEVAIIMTEEQRREVKVGVEEL